MKSKTKNGKTVDVPDAKEIKEYAAGVANIMGEKTIGRLNEELLNSLKWKLTPKEYEQVASAIEENTKDLVSPESNETLKGTDLEDEDIEEVIDEVADTLVEDVTGGPLNPLEQLSKEVNVHDVSAHTVETF